MQLRLLNYSDVPKCKSLWKERFFDSDSFLDFYFTNYFNPSFSYGVFHEDILVSAAYGRDYFLRFGKTVFQGIMIGGVATKSSYEGNHYSHKTINAIISLAEKEGYSFVCLSPVNEHIYEGLGFQTVSYYCKFKSNSIKETHRKYIPNAELLLSIYTEFGKRYFGFPERSLFTMQNKIDEFLSDNDELIMYKKDAYAFINRQKNICDEIAGSNENSIQHLKEILPVGCQFKLPLDLGVFQKFLPNLMIKVINTNINFQGQSIYSMDEF